MNANECLDLAFWYKRVAVDARWWHFRWSREVQRVAWAMSAHPDMTDDRANRWLGYLQGWLSAHRVYTVDELRWHIRERVWEDMG